MYDRVNIQNLMAATKSYLIPHGNRTLSDHLLRCYDLAMHGNAKAEVAYAAGAHSIYGTSSFQAAATEDRNLVISYIGAAAEQLVYMFSRATRTADWTKELFYIDRFTGSKILISESQRQALATMEQINLLEQASALKSVAPSNTQVAQNAQQTGIASKLSNQPNVGRAQKISGGTACCGRSNYGK